jgi:hypothetical protein
MTKQQHPIVPSPQQVTTWSRQWLDGDTSEVYAEWLATCAAQWGADRELDACLEEFSLLWDKEVVITLNDLLKHLRAARRPKPPSLKEQALALVEQHKDGCQPPAAMDWETVRLALEQLND